MLNQTIQQIIQEINVERTKSKESVKTSADQTLNSFTIDPRTTHYHNQRSNQQSTSISYFIGKSPSVLINGVVAGVVHRGGIICSKMIKSIAKNGHINKRNYSVIQLAVMEVTSLFFKLNSPTKPENNQRKSTNKFIKTNATQIKSKKLRSLSFVKEESHFLMMRLWKCPQINTRRKKGRRYRSNQVSEWTLFIMICRTKVKAYEQGKYHPLLPCIILLLEIQIKVNLLMWYQNKKNIKQKLQLGFLQLKREIYSLELQFVIIIVNYFLTIVSSDNLMSNNSLALIMQQVQPNQIKNDEYRTLYFEALEKIRQMSSIENLLQGTYEIVNKIEIKDIISEHEKNLLIMKKQLSQSREENKRLCQELRRQKDMMMEKQNHFMKKIEVQVMKRRVTIEELDLVKGQLGICKKELENFTLKNSQLQDIIDKSQNIQQKDRNYWQNEQNQNLDIFKLTIQNQTKQIVELQDHVSCLEQKIAQYSSQISKLTDQIKKIQQLHQLQNQSKIRLIQNMEKELKKKQNIIQKLNKTLLQHASSEQKQNNSRNANKLEVQSKQKTRLIQRLTRKLKKYQQLLKYYEQKQKLSHQELLKKDIKIENLQHQISQYIQKIKSLQQIAQNFKGSYINAQLQKDQIFEKYKKEQKSLRASRLSNLSLSKLNLTHDSAIETSAHTPISSLKNSQVKMTINHETSTNSNKNIVKKKVNQTKNSNLNDITKSFYKNKTPKTQKINHSRVTPFQI